MIKIVVITHGHLGREIISTAEAIIGKQKEVSVISLGQQEGLTELCNRVSEVIKDVDDSEGALILTDMLGGTPCNACLPFSANDNVEIVSGMNLYMVLSAFINRSNMRLKQLTDKVIEDGKKNISNAKDLLVRKLNQEK
ncbi:MAG: PTS sugar transporter subunit IIA [Endomicrobiales bacterium]|nr:PTS sugar transporter subunit IIA [Endomicrobiales bacterium]